MLDQTNSQETIAAPLAQPNTINITEVDKKIVFKLNDCVSSLADTSKRFPSDNFYGDCFNYLKKCVPNMPFNDKNELKNYLKTDFLRKIDDATLELDPTAKIRLIFSKFLRYKNIELELSDTEDTQPTQVQDQNAAKRDMVVVQWLTTSHYSHTLLSLLQDADWTNCTKIVISIKSSLISKAQQRLLKQLKNKLNIAPQNSPKTIFSSQTGVDSDEFEHVFNPAFNTEEISSQAFDALHTSQTSTQVFHQAMKQIDAPSQKEIESLMDEILKSSEPSSSKTEPKAVSTSSQSKDSNICSAPKAAPSKALSPFKGAIPKPVPKPKETDSGQCGQCPDNNPLLSAPLCALCLGAKAKAENFVGDVVAPKSYAAWNKKGKSLGQLHKEAAAMVRNDTAYVQQFILEWKKKHPEYAHLLDMSKHHCPGSQ